MTNGARVWDPYLTERDLQLVRRFPTRRVGFGSRPAVLLIDNYRAALGQDRLPLLEAVDEYPLTTGLEGWKAVDALSVVVRRARDIGIPVIHVTGTGPSAMPGWVSAIHAGDQRGELHIGTFRSDDHEIIEELAPIDGEVVLRKSAPSAFWGTPLIGLLVYLGVDTLLIGGEATSGCVRASVVDAAANRYRTIVMEDCVYDQREASHAISLFDMHLKYADVFARCARSRMDDVARRRKSQRPLGRRLNVIRIARFPFRAPESLSRPRAGGGNGSLCSTPSHSRVLRPR